MKNKNQLRFRFEKNHLEFIYMYCINSIEFLFVLYVRCLSFFISSGDYIGIQTAMGLNS